MFAGTEAIPLGLGSAEFGMKTIEEFGDVLGLRADASASGGDNFRIQAETLGYVDARGSARNADPEFVRWLQSGLVKPDCGVHDA